MMTYILTFVTNPGTTPPITETLEQLSLLPPSLDYVKLNTHVAEYEVQNPLSREDMQNLRATLDPYKIDVFLTPKANRRKKLLIADMDSTIVTGETLDELAAYAGLKDKIATITAKAMNGELDFHAALKERVALLKDLPADALEQTLKATHLSPGAKAFVQTMKAHSAACILVSGGFTFFTKTIAKQCGFDAHHGNILEIHENRLTGTVAEPILDKNAKLNFVRDYMKKLNLTPADILTIGDGANDLPMLLEAQNNGGLGLGYSPKPAVAEPLINYIRHTNLTSALYAQGYKIEEFETLP